MCDGQTKKQNNFKEKPLEDKPLSTIKKHFMNTHTQTYLSALAT